MPSSDFKKFMIKKKRTKKEKKKKNFGIVNINRIWTNNTEIKLNSEVKILCCADNSADRHEIIMRKNQKTAENLRIPA